MFKMEFKMDNAAFDFPEIEVRRILKKVHDDIGNGVDDGFVFDLNGNKIGEWYCERENIDE